MIKILLILISLFFYSCSKNTEYKSILTNPLNAGFPESLKRFKKNNSFFLIIQNREFDFTKPSLNNLNFGHAQIAWNCSYNNEKYESGIGLTVNNYDTLVLKSLENGYGLNSILLESNQLRLEGPSDIDTFVNNGAKVFSFKVDDCKKVLNNVQKILAKKITFSLLKKDNQYNCMSFILEILSNTEYEHLIKDSVMELKVPSSLLYSGKKITLEDIKNYKTLKRDYKIYFYDPNLLLSNLFSKIN